MGETNGYKLQRLVLLRYRKNWYVWYGVGPWEYHLMDCLGANIYHGRIPDSPLFRDGKEALAWAEREIKAGRLVEGMVFGGHHAGEFACSKGCDDREVQVQDVIVIYDAELYLNWNVYHSGVIPRQKRNLRKVGPRKNGDYGALGGGWRLNRRDL